MGCPSKSEVQGGTCSALIKRENWPLADEIMSATKDGLAGMLPLSVKTRLGFSEVDLGWHEFLLGHDLTMLAVHGRTRKEMSKVPAHWDLIGEVRSLRDKLAPQTLMVGNGDVLSRAQGEALAAQYRLDGIMIGRGIFQDPFVFANESPWTDYTRLQKLELFRRHVQLFIDTWRTTAKPSAPLNKFCKTYVNGFDGAKELREQFMSAKDAEDLLARIAQAI
jgi:tRNA-dihydrouridine synthase